MGHTMKVQFGRRKVICRSGELEEEVDGGGIVVVEEQEESDGEAEK